MAEEDEALARAFEKRRRAQDAVRDQADLVAREKMAQQERWQAHYDNWLSAQGKLNPVIDELNATLQAENVRLETDAPPGMSGAPGIGAGPIASVSIWLKETTSPTTLGEVKLMVDSNGNVNWAGPASPGRHPSGAYDKAFWSSNLKRFVAAAVAT